jgi:hypothetical protein
MKLGTGEAAVTPFSRETYLRMSTAIDLRDIDDPASSSQSADSWR